MEKKKYSIEELKKIVYHESTSRVGGSSVARAVLKLHKDRKKTQANKKTSEMNYLLECAQEAACSGNFQEAQRIIKYLNLQCKCCV